MKYILYLGFFVLILNKPSFVNSQVTALRNGDKIDILIKGNLFTSYVLSEDEKYPYFFPVNGPSKANVTSMRNALYPHHSSLFFGCDKVNGGNFWQEGLDRGQIVSLRADIIESGKEKVVIENENIWKRPGAMAPIKDVRIITVSSPSQEIYQIDFMITLEMLLDVTIEKTNHSLFSIRMDPDLAVVNGGTMVNAEGQTGENNTFGQPSPWMDCYGNRMGKTEGIAILQHPSNPWYPSPWFTRDYGFFSPTPMYWPEDGNTSKFHKGDKITLRYRVLVHGGNHLEAGIAELFENFTGE